MLLKSDGKWNLVVYGLYGKCKIVITKFTSFFLNFSLSLWSVTIFLSIILINNAVLSINNESINQIISTSNHMFGRGIRDKLPECIFTRAISKLSKITRVNYLKNYPNQTCNYWLITPNEQTLCVETNIF